MTNFNKGISAMNMQSAGKTSVPNWFWMLWSFAPGLLAAIFYGVCSGSMSFMNKIVLTSFNYNYPDILMFSQLVMTTVLLEIARFFGFSDLKPWTIERGKEFFFPSMCFALHTTLALAALGHLSIPMYNVVRRLLPLASLFMAHFVLKKTPSTKVFMSVILVVTGCVLAGLGDVQFNSKAYVYGVLSVLAQSIYLAYVQKTGVEKGISALEVLHINSINCIPFMFGFVVLGGSLTKTFYFEQNGNPVFWVAVIMVVSLGCLLNYSLFLCATMNSAVTTSLVGVLKSVLTTFIGFFTFGGVPVTFLTVGGVSLNTLGGIFYTYAKYAEKKEQLSLMLDRVLPITREDVSQDTGHSKSADINRNVNEEEVELMDSAEDRTHA